MSNEMHVIFGSGPLAQATLRALLKRGKRVKMINRSGKRPASLNGEVEMLAGDANDVHFTRQATTGAAVVYQCASPAYQNWQKEFMPLQSANPGGNGSQRCKADCG
jgi:uncharacterized protein YbjT (DUF2867 family)